MSEWEIVAVDRLDLDLIAQPWRFAAEQAAAIDRHWAARLAETPAMFNGRVLMLCRGAVEPDPSGRVFRGAFTATDFKAFLAWREFGSPAGDIRNCFAMAAIETADGAFVLGEMAAHTAPAGAIYFPSGTPDLHDVVDGKVDLEESARRELREETGLLDADVMVEPGMTLVLNETRVACMKRVRSPETADALVARIDAWLADDPKAELARMHVMRRLDDLTAATPSFVTAYIEHRLRG